MGSLVEIGLANALFAGVLALGALLASRYSRRPALIHGLWLLVLVKLVTPPLASVPLPWTGPTIPRTAVAPAASELDRPAAEVARVVVALPAPPAEAVMPPGMRIDELARDKQPKPSDRMMAAPQAVMPAPPPASAPPAPVKVEVSAPPAEAETAASWPNLGRLLAWVWLGGSVVWFLRVGWRVFRFHQLLRHARPAPDSLQKEAERLAQQLGLGRCPGLWLVPGSVPPLLWVVGGRAKVFFPETLLKQIEEPGRSALLVHELAHLRRRDHWVRWLELIVAGLYWWYPLVWLACRRLQAAEEECCDAWVVSELPGYGAAYAGALLETVDFLSRRPVPLPSIASGFGRMHHLKRRLTMIVRESTPRGLSLAGKLLILTLALTLPLAPTRAPATLAPETAAEDPPKKPVRPVRTPSVGAPIQPLLSSNEPSTYLGKPRSLLGNGDPVWTVAVSPDGKTLAVAGEERSIKLLDSQTGVIDKPPLEGHEDAVPRVVFSPDGKTLASAGFDGDVRLWDVATRKGLRTLKGHVNWVFSVAFSPDGKTLASAGYDRTVKLWDAQTGKLLHTFTRHKGGVRAIAFSRNGAVLASAGSDRTIRLWDLAKKEELLAIKGHDDTIRTLAFSLSGGTIASGADDGTVRLWDVAEGRQLALHKIGDVVREVAFSPGGGSLAAVGQNRSLSILDPRTLVVRNTYSVHTDAVTCVCYALDAEHLYTGGTDRTVRQWKAARDALGPTVTFPGSGKAMAFARFSPDGKWLAFAGEDRLLTVRDARAGALLGSLDALDSTVYGLAVSPDGKTLAAACQDKTVKLWDVKSRKRMTTLTGHTFRVWAVAFSPDGKRLASAAGSWEEPAEPGEVKVWTLIDGKEVCALPGHAAPVQALAWSKNGKLLATGSRDGLARLFDANSGKELFVLRRHADAVRSVAFDPQSEYLATGGIDGKVGVWAIQTGKEVVWLEASASGVNCVAWSPDGATLAATSKPTDMVEPGEIRLWQRETSAEATPIFKPKHILKGHTSWVLSAAFSPDGKTLATGGGTNAQYGEVILWDVATGRQTTWLHGHRQWVEALAFGKDGQTLISAGGTKETRGEVRFWQMGGGGWTVPDAHKEGVSCAAWSPDGKLLATGGADKTIILWDAETGKRRATLTGHDGDVRSLAFRRDGKMLASGSADKTVKLWDLRTNQERAELARHARGVAGVAFSPDGKLLATCSEPRSEDDKGGEIKVFDVQTGKERTGAEWSSQSARSVAFSPDGKSLAAGSVGSNNLRIYDVSTGKLRQTVTGARSVRTVAFSPDGKLLATGHGAGSARGAGSIQVWDAITGKERATLLGHAGLCQSIAFSPGGKMLAGASNDGTVKVFDLTASPTPVLTGKAGQASRDAPK